MTAVKNIRLTVFVCAVVGCAGRLENWSSDAQDAASAPVTRDAGWDSGAERDSATVNGSQRWVDAAVPDDASVDATTADLDAGSEDMTQPDAAPACDFRGILQAKCGNAACHGAPASGTGLDLTTAGLGTRIAGRMARGACSDKLLVDTDAPAESALYLKVTGASCGVRMPIGGSLSESEQACVLSWIEGL